MDYYETNRGARVRLILTNEELGLSQIDDLCDKYLEFVSITKEAGSGRKTRSANKRSDQLFEEIMAYRLPPIKLKHSNNSPILTTHDIETNHQQNGTNGFSAKTRSTNSSANSSDSSNSRPITRSLRPRSRTPEVQPKRQMSPSTPAHQRLRAHINLKASSGDVSSNGSSDQGPSVLTAALNQQHPTVSVTKIRQLLRADSVQKKRIRDDEEKERQERLRSDRKAKEERAEIQKKQLLEERAVNAKLKREQRLLHAAEVRKAREEAKLQQKLKEEAMKEETKQQKLSKDDNKKQVNGHSVQQQYNTEKAQESSSKPPPQSNHHSKEEPQVSNIKVANKEKNNEKHHQNNKVKEPKETDKVPEVKENQPAQKLNETFQKPVDEINNIEIVIQDETTTEEETKEKRIIPVATWTKPPVFREALIQQFSKPNFSEYMKRFKEIAPPLMLPVDLKEIFGPRSGTRALVRTSSAVWSPVHRPLKRSSSMVSTPNENQKR